MRRARSQKPSWVKKIAVERIEKLFELAEKNLKRANRYVKIAFELSKKYNATIPRELKRKFCKKCLSYFIIGKNVTVRKERKLKMMIYNCEVCGYANKRKA